MNTTRTIDNTIIHPLPYTKGLSEKFYWNFKRCDVNVFLKPKNTQVLSAHKDPSRKEDACGVVNIIKCGDAEDDNLCSSSYIEEIARSLKT